MKNICLSLLVLICWNLAATGQLIEARIDSILKKMTIEEKILQLHREGDFNTATNSRLGIPGLVMADGPHGVRSGLATSFPVGIALAATWDPDLVFQVGEAMGREFRGKGMHQALGPCIDLTRDPRNGRSPESGGEDPYLNAMINLAMVRGIQSTPCLATVKHYNGVNRQTTRTTNNVIITRRQLMEHYGLNFRTAVQEGGVFSVMNAYNLINGEKCAENYILLTSILRQYWGFPFYVVSDWGSIWNSKKAIEAGCNICMGSDHYKNDLPILLANGDITETTIDLAVRNVLRTKILSGMMDFYPPGDPADVNSGQHQQLARKVATKSVILLKNENNILPINPLSRPMIAIIGPSAAVAQLDGTGSSYVTPFYTVTPLDAFTSRLGDRYVFYEKGCDINSTDTSGFIPAVQLAMLADYVIFIGGLDQTQEGEGLDRVGGSVELPITQQLLINRLAAANPNLIVVIESGGICALPRCIDNIPALLYAFYPGQEGGNALADIILGDVNPSGKLPVTMPVDDSQLPPRNDDFTDDFGCGYRWFDANNITPQFPFGFGLSYTTFQLSDLQMWKTSYRNGEPISFTVRIANTGEKAGEEVVQVYVSSINPSVPMPVKELKAFKKINLEPGEERQVDFTLNAESFYYYDETDQSYKVLPGQYRLRIGNSSAHLPLEAQFEVQPDLPRPDLKITRIFTMPRFPLEGDSVYFGALVKNQGSARIQPGEEVRVDFYVGNRLISGYRSLNLTLKPGEARLVQSNVPVNGKICWMATSTGDVPVYAVIDPENRIPEWMEDNNFYTDTLTIHHNPPVNLALHAHVTVSSVENSSLSGEKAVDGDYTTRWSSAFSDPQTLTIDFGKVVKFNRIRIFWETAYGKKYQIHTSMDGLLWKLIVNETAGDGGIDEFIVPDSARFLRFTGQERGTEWGYSIFEFEVYNDPAVKITPEKAPLARMFYLYPLHPNPFNPIVHYQIKLNEPCDLTINVFNVAGQKILSDKMENLKPGIYRKTFTISSYGTGIYFFQTIVSNGSRTESVTQRGTFIK